MQIRRGKRLLWVIREVTTLISARVGVGKVGGRGAFFGSLWQPPSHKSTVAEMKGGEDPVEARRKRGRNENELLH